jgi:hypothetical protein
MNRMQFLGEFNQILALVRAHAFLSWSPAGQAEYAQKITAAFTHYRSLVRSSTGIELPPDDAGAVDLAGVRVATIAEAARVLTRCGLRAGEKKEAAGPWLRAANAIRSLR